MKLSPPRRRLDAWPFATNVICESDMHRVNYQQRGCCSGDPHRVQHFPRVGRKCVSCLPAHGVAVFVFSSSVSLVVCRRVLVMQQPVHVQPLLWFVRIPGSFILGVVFAFDNRVRSLCTAALFQAVRAVLMRSLYPGRDVYFIAVAQHTHTLELSIVNRNVLVYGCPINLLIHATRKEKITSSFTL